MHRRGERQHRITPVDQPSRAGMVGLTAEGEVPSAVRPDRRGHGDRPAQVLQRPALFDVKLDIHTDAFGERVVGADAGPGGGPRSRSASASVVPSLSRSASARSAVNAPVLSCDPTHATPNRAPSSSANATTAIGMTGATPRARTRSTAWNADTTPEWPVERATVGHRVEVRSGDECAPGVAAPTRRASTMPTCCRYGPLPRSCRDAALRR